jgi:hypothetical protein
MSQAYAPIVALLCLVREDAARRGETTTAPDPEVFAKAFAASRVEHARRQNDSAIASQIFEAVLAIEHRPFEAPPQTVRQLISCDAGGRLPVGVYVHKPKQRLLVVWTEVLPHLSDEWRRRSAASMRQLAERDPRHISDDAKYAESLKAMQHAMGRGHAPSGVSMWDIAELSSTGNIVVIDETRPAPPTNGAVRTPVPGDMPNTPQTIGDIIV